MRFGGTAGATATGTAGSVLFFGATGAISEDNAQFFWDDTNNFLGIGTSAPVRKLHSTLQDSSTNTVTFGLRVEHTTTGTAAAGFGVQIEFALESGGGNVASCGRIQCVLTVATDTAETANFVWQLIVAGALKEVLRSGVNGVQGVLNTLADGANVAIDASLFTPGSVGRLTTTQNFTLDDPTNPQDRQLLYIEITSANSRTIAYGSAYKGSADLALPAATTGGGKADVLLFRYNSVASQWWLLDKNFGFAA